MLAQEHSNRKPHVTISSLCTKENYILQVLEDTVIFILHIYCALLGELGGEKGCVVLYIFVLAIVYAGLTE